MQLKQLTIADIRFIFDELLAEDFPAAERKPFAMIAPLAEAGMYLGYGLYDGDTLCAYALFVRAAAGRWLLLDYLAVTRARRAAGLGSRFLSELAAYDHGFDGFLGEIEHIALGADAEETAIRQRRLAFYQRNGWRLSGVCTRVYGVTYNIILLPFSGAALSDDAVQQELDQVYCAMFPPQFYRQEVAFLAQPVETRE